MVQKKQETLHKMLSVHTQWLLRRADIPKVGILVQFSPILS